MVKSWTEVVTPHKDVLSGRLDESVFAADLEDVVQGRAPSDYLYPEVFFAKTYPTDGLVNLLANVVSRLSGKGGDPVISLQTPFGGGKTHALIALYHLCKGGERAQQSELVRQVLARAGVDHLPPCKVAVFVGTSPSVHDMTPWGSIAQQLGSYDAVAESDRSRSAPGTERLHRVLGDGPVLLLMDEVVEYGVKARGLRDQLMAAMQELTQAVKVKERTVLVATLPSSAPYGEEGERVLHQLEMIFGRAEAQYELVRDEEIYEVVRRRLFQDLGDEGERQRAVQAYWEMYQSLGDDVPAYAREPAYRLQMLRAYPFHPEVVDVLFQRWSTFPTFQRTRGVLRLLGEVVGTLYRGHHPSPLIQPAHVDLRNDHIRRELVKHIGNEYNGVIAADISGPNARAARLDQEMGADYARYNIATGLATSVFFGSFSGAERRGVTLPWLRLAVLRPGVPAALVGDAIKRLEDELWYLHSGQGLYWFTNQPNLNRIRIEREEAVREEQVTEELRRLVERLAGSEFRTFVWPQAPQDVPDTKELKLAVLGPEHTRPGAAEELASRLLEQAGTTFRAYRNTLVVLVPDRGELASLRQKVRRLLALRSIRDDRDLWARLSEENRRKVDDDLKSLQEAMELDVRSTYRHLAKDSLEGILWLDMGIPTVGERVSLARRVRDYLRDSDILAERIAPSQLLDKALAEGEKEKPLSEVRDLFLRYPHLPMLEGQHVVEQAAQAGARNKVLGVRVGDKIYFGESPPGWASVEEVVLVRPEVAQGLVAPQEGSVAGPAVVGPETGQLAGSPQPAATAQAPGVAPEATGIRRVVLRVELPWDKLSDFLRGVVLPLRQDNADIRLQVFLEAEATAPGIQRTTLEHKVDETLSQLGANILERRLE
jgi:hypothetical protein